MHACGSCSLLAFVIVLAIGCRKEPIDEQGPSITIAAPDNSTTLHIPDTLHVSFDVSDDHMVGSVWISLGDINGVPIAPSVTVNVNSDHAHIERDIIVSDLSIQNGNYSLAVRASDGTNMSSAFRSVNVVGSPLRLRAVYVSHPGGSITRVDSVGDVSSFTTVAGLSAIEVNSFTQQLFVASGPFDPLEVLSLNGEAPSWQLPNQNSGGGNYFLALYTDPMDDRTYVSSNDGAIRGYDRNGVPQFTAQAMPGWKPSQGVVSGARFLSVQQVIGTNEKRLVSYTYSSGDPIQSFTIDVAPLKIFPISDQEILLWGTRDGQGIIEKMNVTQGGAWDVRIFTNGPMMGADRISTTSFVVAFSDRVMRFDLPSNSVTTLFSGPVSDFAFDRANNIVLVGSGDQLLAVDPGNGMAVNSIALPALVDHILPLFDR